MLNTNHRAEKTIVSSNYDYKIQPVSSVSSAECVVDVDITVLGERGAELIDILLVGFHLNLYK